ncbi:hypothetical protein [Singulisphaera sp. GP187]|uniref:hypothetical protein n=1 Tax=Singulisphaera sp. GP187 TaxID=1882752 RepID=UPI0020B14B69|nr:hypothetical protein [Singulisphaera sp. GP187]
MFALVLLDIVLVQSVILGRPLRAFHYTFLVVGLVASMALTVLAFMPTTSGKTGSLQILGTLIRWYESIAGNLSWNHPIYQYLESAERCATSTLGLLMAWAAGLLVARLVDRWASQPGSRIRYFGSFFQGALIGLAVFTPIGLAIGSWAEKSNAPQAFIRIIHGSCLALVPLLGGCAANYLNHWRSPDESAIQGVPDPSEISAS